MICPDTRPIRITTAITTHKVNYVPGTELKAFIPFICSSLNKQANEDSGAKRLAQSNTICKWQSQDLNTGLSKALTLTTTYCLQAAKHCLSPANQL